MEEAHTMTTDTDTTPQLSLVTNSEEAEAQPFYPLLRVWREILAPASDPKVQRVTPQWATRLVSTHAGLTFADVQKVCDRYFERLGILTEILDAEIATDPNCLSYTTIEEDAELNRDHYLNLLMLWQQQFLLWELEWSCTADDAAIDIASADEVFRFFFGQTGITAYLDNIGFQFDEIDQEQITEALTEMRTAFESAGSDD